MHIEHPPFKAPHERRAQYAHEAGQQHEIGREGIDALGQRVVKGLAAVVGLVVHHRGDDAAALPQRPGPRASGRLASTATTWAGQRCSAQRCTMASMLEPRPETRMTMRFMSAAV
jgi:hypothetical protein